MAPQRMVWRLGRPWLRRDEHGPPSDGGPRAAPKTRARERAAEHGPPVRARRGRSSLDQRSIRHEEGTQEVDPTRLTIDGHRGERPGFPIGISRRDEPEFDDELTGGNIGGIEDQVDFGGVPRIESKGAVR